MAIEIVGDARAASRMWDSPEWGSTERDATEWDSTEFDSTEFDSTEFDSTEFDSTELDSTELGSAEWGTAEWERAATSVRERYAALSPDAIAAAPLVAVEAPAAHGELAGRAVATGRAHRLARHAVASLALRPGDAVVSVGARVDAFVAAAADALPGGHLRALVDRRHARPSAEDVAVRLLAEPADARFLPVEYASVDGVVAVHAAVSLPREVDRRQALRETVRVVRHGRRVAAVVRARHARHALAVLREAGCDEVDVARSRLRPGLALVTARRPPDTR